MAWKVYLGPQTQVSLETTPTTSQSTTLPAGTPNDQSWILLKLRDYKGTNDVLGNVTTLAQTARQDARIKPWLSDRLVAQTIAAATWTFAFEAFESSANVNAFVCLVLYAWRPSTATKVGTIYDSATALGNEFALTQTGRVVTFSGAEVTVQDSDFLVLEVWETMTQSMATSYTTEFATVGATEPTEGSTTGNAATYLSCPNDIVYYPFPPVLSPRHLRNSLLRR